MSEIKAEQSPVEGDGAKHPATSPVTPTIDAAAEIGGRKGPDPTRYGDWEKNGRCIDF